MNTVRLAALALALAARPAPEDLVLHRTLDLGVGESGEVESRGRKVQVKLLDLHEIQDEVNSAVRRAEVKLEVNGETATIISGTYHLPVLVGGVQVDSPITRGYLVKARKNVWGLKKDARIRVWPAGSAWIPEGTFVYPARQRWFATLTQMGNEPTYVDGGDEPAKKDIYYHYGFDIGGSEGLVDVVAATEGVVVSSGAEVLAGHEKGTPVDKRYDVIYLMDARGWYYRYSHLKFFEPWVRPGAKVQLGQKLGVLGKEGGSGGWTHLHFDVTCRQPSGEWGIEDAYAFLWESYQRERPTPLIAVARPHHLVWAGQKVELDASLSSGGHLKFEWTFTEGGTAVGPKVERVYAQPGVFSEIVKVTDGDGRVDYDFQVVHVLDRADPAALPPSIHANYAPTLGIRPGDPVTFRVRSFRTKEPGETWDFGDGSPPVQVRSDGNADQHAPNGYADAIHRYAKPGHYLVRVENVNARGQRAVARLQVRVGMD